MFKGLAAFFETYTITATDAKNQLLQPIDVSLDVGSAVKRVQTVLAAKGYGEMIEDNNFKELFAKAEKFEITVSFITLQNGGTRIGAALYSPKGKLTKKILIGIMRDLNQEFVNEKI